MTITLNVPGSNVLTLGGDAVGFDFTLSNPVAAASAQTVGIVASMGHCSCAPGGAKLSPKGSMELFDASGNTWKPVTFVREGTGMDYLTQPVVPSITLAPGQTAAYRMQVRLAQDPQVTYTAGTSAITVTLELPGTLTSLGSAAVPVTVQP